jgi:hypothetical protein
MEGNVRDRLAVLSVCPLIEAARAPSGDTGGGHNRHACTCVRPSQACTRQQRQGSSSTCGLWPMGRDPACWCWEKPEEFYPERFDGISTDFYGSHYELLPLLYLSV